MCCSEQIEDTETRVRDGGTGYIVLVDGVEVCEIRNDETDLGDSALQPLWDVLNLTLTFDEE